MIIAIVIISIFAIFGITMLANKILPFRVCPICAGVAGTWLWILAGLWIGWLEADSWKLAAAIAMGGSVVGVAYQIEKRLPADRSGVMFKVLFIPAGFIAVYSFLLYRWFVLVPALVFLAIVVVIFLKGFHGENKKKSKTVEELEKKMEDCC